MNPCQARAIRIVQEGVNALSAELMKEFDISEDDALEIVRELPELTSKLQGGEIHALYEVARSEARRTINSPHNPKEYYPGHPQHQPMYTTKHTFNAHMAQATAPYVVAIAKKIAKDRGLAAPSDAEIKAALKRVDWASAAYEYRTTKNPNPSKARRWLLKYIFKPLDKFLSFPFEQYFFILSGATMLMMLWKAFGVRLTEHGKPVMDTLIWSIKKMAGG